MRNKNKYASLFLSLMLTLLITTVNTSAQISSNKLKANVESALDRYYMDEFHVTTDNNGTVTIKGEVSTLYDQLNVFEIVSAVKGVKEIKDLLTINTPMQPDDMIKANIETALKNNSIILEPDKITVKVSSGLVFLEGAVSYYKEKLMAETISSWQDGVLGIENDLTVLPVRQARSDDNIKSVLIEILNNKFPLINNRVNINVNNGIVTLNGEVWSLWEKINLKKEFMQVLGVKSVVENLKVNYTESD